VDAQATNILIIVETARIVSLTAPHVLSVVPARPVPLALLKRLTLRLVIVLVALTWILPLKHAKPVVLAVPPVQMLKLVLSALMACYYTIRTTLVVVNLTSIYLVLNVLPVPPNVILARALMIVRPVLTH